MEKIRKFKYKYVDDKNEEPSKCYFIGTKKEFNEMTENEQNLWGSIHYDIEEAEPTQEEIKYYKENGYYEELL